MNSDTASKCVPLKILIVIIFFAVLSISNAFAQAVSWDGGGGTNLWTTPNNWSNDAVPTSSNAVTINAGVRVLLNATGNCASLTIGGSGLNDTLVVQSGNTLNVGGAVTIQSDGVLELAGNAMMYLAGNWINNREFIANSSTVVFNGTSAQTITNNSASYLETFFNLSLSNSSGTNALSNTGGSPGTRIVINGNLAINDGEFEINKVTSGTGADLKVVGDLTLALAGEGLNLDDANIVAEFGGNVNINDTDTNPPIPVGTSSTIIMNGSGNQTWGGNRTTSLTVVDYTVNKSSGTLTINRPITVNEDFDVLAGTAEFSSTDTLKIGNNAGDSLIVRSGGTFRLNAGSNLAMFAGSPGSVISVEAGGHLEILGSSRSNRASITRQGTTGTYAIDIYGTIKAKYGNFNYMDANGVLLEDDAILDATDNFDFSRFGNGVSTGTYLTVGNLNGGPQGFQIDSVTFADVLDNGYNVVKTSDTPADTLRFYGADGYYAGEDLDNDPGNLVLWFGTRTTLTWAGSSSTSWTSSLNWRPRVAPNETYLALIPAGMPRYPTITASAAIRDLTINNGASVTLNTGLTLDIKENFTNSGTLTLNGTANLQVGKNFTNTSGTITVNQSTITFDSTLTQTITTGGTGAGKQFYNLTVNKPSGSATLSGNLQVNNSFTLSSGTFDAGSSSNAITVANNWSNAGTYTHRNNTVTFSGTGTITGGGTGSGRSLYNVIFAGTTHTLGSDLKVNNNLNIQNAGTTLDASTNNYNIQVAGNWDITGTFTPRQGTVTFNGTADQTVDFTPNNFYNLTVDKASGSVVNTTASVINVSHTLNVNSGGFVLSGENLDVGTGGVTIGSAGTLNSGANTVNVAAGWSNSGILSTAAGSQIIFDATSGSYSIAEPTLNALQYVYFTGGATYTLVASLDVNQKLTIGAGATLVANEQDINVARSWHNSGTFNAGTGGTVTFDGAGPDSIFSGGSSFYNVTINQSAAATAIQTRDNLDINHNFYINQGAFSLAVLNNNLNVGGSMIIAANGSMTPGTGMVTFDAQTGGPFEIDDGNQATQFDDITINAGSGVVYNLVNNSDSETNFLGDLYIRSGTLDLNGQTLNYGSQEAVDYDSLVVDGKLVIGPNAILKINATQTLGNSDLVVVRNGGLLQVVGSAGAEAVITRLGEGESATRKWRMFIKSGGTIEARDAIFRHYDGTNGIYLETGAILDPVNNFTNCQFDLISANGRYLRFGDLSGNRNYTISNAGFLNRPSGATPYNVDKANVGSDTLFFNGAYGVFAGEDYDLDPAETLPLDSGMVVWRNTIPSRVWTGATSTAWNTAGNWVGNQVPSPTENVFIPNVANDPVVSLTDTCADLTLGNGANLTINGTGILYVAGDLRFGASGAAGRITMNTGSNLYVAGDYDNQYGDLIANTGSTITFNGSEDQQFHPGNRTLANKALYNLTINKSSGMVRLLANIDVLGSFNLISGGFDQSASLGYNMYLAGSFTNTGGTLIPGEQTVFFDGTSGNINGGSGSGREFYRVVLQSGTYTLTGDMDVNWELQINTGATLNASSYTIYLARLLDNDGSFDAGTGTLELNGTESVGLDVAAPGLSAFYNLTINKLNNGVINVTPNGSTVVVNGNFNVTSGTFNFNTTDGLDVAGNVVISPNGTLSRTANVTITAAGNWLNTGTFTNTTGLVTFDGVNQTLTGSFYNVTLAGSGIKTAGESLDFNNNLTINNGVTFEGSGYSHTIGGNWTNNGSYNPGTGGTIAFDGTINQTVTTGGTSAGKIFGNFVVNNTGADATNNITLVGNLKVSNDLTMINGDLHSETNNVNVNVGGNWTVTSPARFYPGTGLVTFDGISGGPYNINNDTAGATTNIFNALTVNASGVVYQLANTLRVNGNLVIPAGTLDLNHHTLLYGDGNTDSIKVTGGTLEVDDNASLQMYTATGSGSDLVVQSGGTLVIVGSPGSNAGVTRFNGTGASDLYSFTVRNGGAIQARYAQFEYMDANGINLQDGAILHPINNFSNVNFNNGPSGGRFLNVGDISGSNQKITISSAAFLNNPGGGAYNVQKSNSSDTLNFDQATGVFAGEAYDNDPLEPTGNLITWTNTVATRDWTGLTGQNWATASNWQGNQVPTANENANIPAGAPNMPVVYNTQVARSVTVAGGASLTINSGDTLDLGGSITINSGATLTMSGDAVLHIAGDYINAGTIVENTSKLIFDGTGDQGINAYGQADTKELYNLTINKTGGIATLSSDITMNGNLEIISGNLDVSTTNYAMLVRGNWINNGNFTPRQGTVTLETAGSSLTTGGSSSGKRFYNLTLANAASKTLAGDLGVNNNLVISSGTTLDVSTSNYNVYVGGAWMNDGSFTPRNGTVILDGSGSQSLDVVATAGSFYNFTVNKSGGTATLTNSPLDINGAFTITAGTLNFDSYAINIEGITTNSGTLTGSGTITAAGDWIGSGGTLSGTNTVTFDGDNQTISGMLNNVVMGGTGIKTAGGVLDINGNLTINTGVTFDAASYTHTLAGNWDNTNGIFNANTSTIVFDSTAATQTVTTGGIGSSKAFNNFTIKKTSGTVSLPVTNNIQINGNFTVQTGTMTFDGNLIYIGGNWNNAGTITWTAGIGEVIFNAASGTHTIADGNSGFALVTINAPTATYQLTELTNINAKLKITAGTLDLNGQIFEFGDASTDSISVSGILEVDEGSFLRMFTTTNAGAVLTVNNGGTVRVVGIQGNLANVTRYNGTQSGDRYTFTVNSGGTIEARYAKFDYMNSSGIHLNDGAIINTTNNFSDTQFENGPSGGRYLYVGDISGTNQNIYINNVGFISDPGGGAYNVDKTTSTDTLRFDSAYGVFAGESYDNDPADIVIWTNTQAAVVWTGAVSEDWATAGNWQGGSVPTTNDDVIIPNVSRDPVLSGRHPAKSLTILSGGFLTISDADTLNLSGSISNGGALLMGNNAALYIAGNYSNSGSLTTNYSTIIFNGTNDQTITSGGTSPQKTFYNLTINKSTGTVFLAGAIKITKHLNLIQGTLDVTVNNYQMNIGGDWINNGTFLAHQGTVVFEKYSTLTTGGSGTGKAFYTVRLYGTPSANVILAGDIRISNNLLIETGTTFDVGTANYAVYLGGNWDNDGSFNARNGAVTFDGLGSQTVDAAATLGNFYDLNVNKSASSVTLSEGPLVVNHSLNIYNGTVNLQNQNADINGNVLLNSTLTTGANSITVSGDWSGTGFFVSSGTVTFDGTTQSLRGSFNNLVLGGSGSKTAIGSLDINGNVTINSGVTFNSQSYSHTLAGNYTNSGTLNASSSTFTFDGSGNTQTVTSGGTGTTRAFNNVTVNKSSGMVILATGNALEIRGNLTINSGTLSLNTNNLFVAGNFTNTGSFLPSTGTLTFNATTVGPFNIDAGSSAFGLVTVNAPGRVYQLTNNLTINGNLLITAGTLDLNSRTLNFGDSNTDTIGVAGTLEVDAGASLRLYASSGSGARISVTNGGTARIVGSSGNLATVTRYNGTGASDRYGFRVFSGGTMAANYALFEYMNINGIVLDDNAILDATNNFSNTNFDNGAASGRYLAVGDLSGGATYTITSTGFLRNPGGVNPYNVVRTTAGATEILNFDEAFGPFAGENYDYEPGTENTITWTNIIVTIVWAGGGTIDWAIGSNWVGGLAPDSTQEAYIPNGATPYPTVTNTRLARGVTIESGVTLTVNATDTLRLKRSINNSGYLVLGNTAVLRIGGNYNNPGLLTPNTSTIILDGNIDQGVNAGGSATGKPLYNLLINKSSGAAILSSALNVNNDLTIQSGTLDVSASNFTITLVRNWVNNGTFTPRNGTVQLSGNTTLTTGGAGTGKALYNLTLLGIGGSKSGGGESGTIEPVLNAAGPNGSQQATVTLSGDLAVSGNLIIQNGASLDVTTSNYAVTVGGNWDNDGSFNARNGTVTLNGSAAQSIDANALVGTFYNFTINKPAGTATLIDGPLNMNGNLAISNGTLSTGTWTINIEGSTTINGTLSTGVSTITAAGNWTNSGTFSGSNTVTLDGAAQSLNGSFYNLVLSGSGTKTASAALDVNNNFTISSGITFSAGSYTHTFAGNWNNAAGIFTSGSSTLTFDGTGTQTLTSGGTGVNKALNNLVVNKTSGTLQLAAGNALEVNGNLTITSGTLNANTNAMNVAGSFINSGTFIPSSGTLTFDGSGGPFTINDGNSSLGVVTINAAGTTYQLAGGTDIINGNLTIMAGTLNLNGNTLQFGDAVSDAISVSGTLNIDANATLRMFTGSNSGAALTVNNGGTIIVVGTSGSLATVTRFSGTGASDRYGFTIRSGGTIQANNAAFEYMNTSGIYLQDGAILDATNNFSNTTFDNGTANGIYLQIGNVAGASSYTITSTGFLTNPGGTSFNVAKTISDDHFTFDQAYGDFAGPLYESDPGNIVDWTNLIIVTTWTGNSSDNWGTAANWTQGVPTANDDAIIPDVSRDPVVRNRQVARSVTIRSNGFLTISDGDTLTLSGSITNSGIITITNAGMLRIAGNYTNTSGVLNSNSSTIVFTGSTNQTITTGGTAVGKRFYNLLINKSAASAILNGNIDINGSFTDSSGTFDVGASDYSMNVAGNWINLGTLNARNGTVTLDGTAAQSVNAGAANAFYNLVIATTNTVSLSSTSMDANNDLTINTNATLNANGQNITVGGNWANSGTFNPGTALVTFDGSVGPYTINNNNSSFNNVTVNAGSGVSYALAANLDINGNLTVSAGTFNVGNHTLTFGDAGTDAILVSGRMEVNAGGVLQMFNATTLTVASGGTLAVIGSGASNLAEITRLTSGNYQIVLQSGSTIAANYARFNYTGATGAAGIIIPAGASINSSDNFAHCIFQNGIGTSYLQIANTQSLDIPGVQFYSGPTYNIDYSGSGNLAITDYLGDLSSARFENDPSNHVRWTFIQASDVSGSGPVTFGNDMILDPTAAGQFGQVTVELRDVILPSARRSAARHYIVQPAGIGNATADLTLYYTDQELDGMVEANLNLWRRSGPTWVGPIDPTSHNTTTNEFIVSGLTFSRGVADTLVLSDAENDQSLPVQLLAFSAEVNRGLVELRWTTASELGNSYFMIERSETAETDYVEIGRLDGQGNTSIETEYSFVDDGVQVGIKYYYRLLSVDYAGGIHIADKLEVEVLAPAVYRLSQNYPNPFNMSTTVQYELPETADIGLTIYNILGQEVYSFGTLKQPAGFYRLQWNGKNRSGSSVASGMYIFRFTARSISSGKQFTKVIKAILMK
jgi:hypothetical protein